MPPTQAEPVSCMTSSPSPLSLSKKCNSNSNSPIHSSSNSSLSNSPLSPKQETVIIFDWDDTLLASSFLSGRGYRLDSEIEKTAEVDTQLKELEQSVVSVLNMAISYGEVHVITNAETGWVQLSAQKFIPGVVPLLSKVKVLSARSTYENFFPESPLKWKFYAFQENLSRLFAETKIAKNIISFGDSHVEREAVRAVTRGFPNTRTKSVKFAERPSMEQLRRQIELVTNCFHYIHNHEGDLDLQLTVTVNNVPNVHATPTSPSSSEPTTPTHQSTPTTPTSHHQHLAHTTSSPIQSTAVPQA